MSTAKHLPLICGLTDGTLTVVGAFIIGLLGGKAPSELLSQNMGLLLIIVVPASLAVTWRGSAHTVRLLAGNRGWVRPAVEGFILGAIPFPLFQLSGILQEAMAAGTLWPTIGYSPLSEWLRYLGVVSAVSAATGAIGALYAVFLPGVNRSIIHVFQ